MYQARIEIPKSEIELELDRKIEENQKKANERTEELKLSELVTKTDRELFLEAKAKKRQQYFIQFKQKFGIPLVATMEQVFTEIENSRDAFEDFVDEQESGLEEEAEEYLDVDDGGDSAY